jgi:hypothetical protein
MDLDLPAPLLISPPGSFAWDVFHRRHSALISNIRGALPYEPEQHAALQALLDESQTGDIRPLRDDAPDADQWRAWDRGYVGKPWEQAPFLWAEAFFFRRVLEATGYHGGSAWAGVDPYAPMKAAELADPALDTAFAWHDNLADRPPRDRIVAALEGCVLANRADLVFQTTELVEHYNAINPPLADDTPQIWRHLADPGHGYDGVAIVCDNTGRELLADLLLAYHLLATGTVERVDLHVKPVPSYISDATTADVGACLARLRAMPGLAGSAGADLFERAALGELRIHTDPFWCAPLPFHDLPEALRRELAGRLVVFKGDLNYRRLVGDCFWDPATPFPEAVGYLGLPVAALRTVKSDVVVGLPAGFAELLDAKNPAWRLTGTHTLIQAAL